MPATTAFQEASTVLELPEVEVLRKDLDKEVVGKRVKDVVVEAAGVVRPFHRTRPDFVNALAGRKIEGARRRGSVIFLDLDDELTWVIDAGPAGSVFRETANATRGRDTQVVVTFTIGGALHLSDTSKDAEASTGIVATDEALEAAGINPTALDPLDDNPTWMDFGRYLHAADKPLKALLTDTDVIVGIGPVYSDEILWEAGLRHDHPSKTLSTQEVRRLYRAMQEVIVAAVKQRGSNLDDAAAETAVDDEGGVATHLKVYGRNGLPCPRCRQTILRTRLKKGVYTYHCAQCMI